MGKLDVPENTESIIEDEGYTPLLISLHHGGQAGLLPDHHKDPFDRILIAQAMAEGPIIVTSDEKFLPYKVRRVDANK